MHVHAYMHVCVCVCVCVCVKMDEGDIGETFVCAACEFLMSGTLHLFV